MYHKDYSNFVRPVSDEAQEQSTYVTHPKLSGKEARDLYLEEVQTVTNPQRIAVHIANKAKGENSQRKRKIDINLSDKELFQSVQNNDIYLVQSTLDMFPNKVNLIDEFGWSLLMIACQANSIDIVKELLKRGVDTSVRDKSGNSAQSLIIKNKNLVLADILLSHQQHEDTIVKKAKKVKLKEEFKCEVCENVIFPDKMEHLSSTLHNINASKGKKIPTKFVIPESNRGYQIMLKEGWDKETGLGPDGAGTKYPIKAIMKKDRTGLGLKKKDDKSIVKESPKTINKKFLARSQHYNKIMEINFRREFY